MKIIILGLEDPNYRDAEVVMREVTAEMGIDAEITVVTDITEVAEFGLSEFPAVIIDDEVKCSGSVPTKEEVKVWFKEESYD